MSYDSHVPTALLTADSLVRRGLSSFLDGTHFRIVEPVTASNEVDEVDETGRNRLFPALILSALKDVQSVETTRAQHVAFPEAKLVIFGRPDVPGTLPRDLCFAAYAILTYDTDRETLISALDLVMSGAKVQSPGLLSRLLDQTQQPFGMRPDEQPVVGDQSALGPLPEASGALAHPLSSRELGILQFLKDGASNKVIARELSLRESTVKVHVKNVLRKLGAQNRTQASIWAREHGI